MRGGVRKAAALRGVSGSALSHSIRGLEARLGVRLFHRTSRSISLTAAGEVLLAELEPRFLGIQAAMDLLDSFRSGPTGRVRVTTLRDAAELLIAPRLHSFRKSYPDVEVEVSVEDRFIDMVAEGFDAGIRYGGTVPEGMIASRLTSELEWIVVGSPAYLNERGRPARPEDLLTHECIRIRTGTDHLCKWELGDGDRMVSLDVPGLLTLGDSELSIRMAEGEAVSFIACRPGSRTNLRPVHSKSCCRTGPLPGRVFMHTTFRIDRCRPLSGRFSTTLRRRLRAIEVTARRDSFTRQENRIWMVRSCFAEANRLKNSPIIWRFG